RARQAKAAGVLVMAVCAHLSSETTDIAFDAAAFGFMDRPQVRGERKLHRAHLAEWSARRSSRRPVDASATDLLSNFTQILLQFGFRVHGPPPLRHHRFRLRATRHSASAR